jgi:hypothetical protein
MIIDYKNIKVKELQAICRALNETELLAEPIEVKPVGQKKQVLATAFVEAIHECNDMGELNNVPDEIYDYYLAIAVPEEGDVVEEVEAGVEEEAEVVEDIEEAPPPPKRGRGRKTAPQKEAPRQAPARGRKGKGRPKDAEKQPEATKKRTVGRAKVAPQQTEEPKEKPQVVNPRKTTRAQLFVEIVSDGHPRTKKELVKEMIERYEGSTTEAPFWVNVYVGVAIAFGRMEKLANGTFVLLE